MIIENGTLVPRRPSRGRIDPESGHPEEGLPEWGAPIPCQYIPNRMDLAGHVNGERAVRLSYTVLLERPFCYERVRLCDSHGCVIGEFPVISVEWLEAVGQCKVLI